jgi:hypothetical protein
MLACPEFPIATQKKEGTMKRIILIFVLILSGAVCCRSAAAQAPPVTVDPSRHGNLAAAQQSVAAAFQWLSDAQHENDAHLGGHAGRAKELLREANEEIQLSADFADQHSQGGPSDGPPPTSSDGPPPTAPDGPPPTASAAPAPQAPTDLSGTWTIYAYNINQPGSSLKKIQITQQGNILSGTFHGPHQHGKMQGYVNGNHVEFSTDTRDVLTFRGEITTTGMSGMYGVHGEHAPWTAERTN